MFVYIFEEISACSSSVSPPEIMDLHAIAEGMLTVLHFDRGKVYKIYGDGKRGLLAESPLDPEGQFHIHTDDPYGRGSVELLGKPMQIEVIYTFYRGKQSVVCLEFATAPSKEKFLGRAISYLQPMEQEDLAKISACQFTTSESAVLPWVVETNGKFYFEEGEAAKYAQQAED